jgi:hypothetical protein
MLRRADLAAENRGRAPLTQTCPADLACMPSKKGKARHITQTGGIPREAGHRRETRRLTRPLPTANPTPIAVTFKKNLRTTFNQITV